MDQVLIDRLSHLQDSFNESISANWKSSRTELDFMIALSQEIAELIDTNYEIEGRTHGLQWKWWKGVSGTRTTDYIRWSELHPKVLDNIKIELTDCLFFALSQKELVDFSSVHQEEEDLIDSNDWENIMRIVRYSLNHRPTDSIKVILYLANKIGFNIAAYYLAKFTLNHIRQLSGYKTGTYKKVRDGVEDNELLHEVIKDITLEDLRSQFPHFCGYIMNRVYDLFDIPSSDRKDYTSWTGLDMF